MSKAIPQIKKYMTTEVQTIGDEQPMSIDHRLMREQHIRHLPVLHQGKDVGIVTDRDLHLVATLDDVDPRKIAVSEAMTPDPYVVTPDASLEEVVATMAAKKYGSIVVSDHGHVVGIFTTVDACSAFAELLTTRLSH